MCEKKGRGAVEKVRVYLNENVCKHERKREELVCVSVSVLVASPQKRDGYVTARVCLNCAHS